MPIKSILVVAIVLFENPRFVERGLGICLSSFSVKDFKTLDLFSKVLFSDDVVILFKKTFKFCFELFKD